MYFITRLEDASSSGYCYTCRSWSVCACLLVTRVITAKTAARIDMFFGGKTHVDPRNVVLDEGGGIPTGSSIWGGQKLLRGRFRHITLTFLFCLPTLHLVMYKWKYCILFAWHRTDV